ncbi:maltose alpha-D-glucosyltransferase [Spirochaeta africana]|nr:maltose alpha-D-glucosyltransferase [Spirochaeta africana]
METKLHTDAWWYKEAIIYEVHVKSFYDSNRDGIGDIRGLTEKLDYLQQLGVTAIWVLPFYPSPLRDDGYDIADYYAINPDYGTLDDFRELLAEAHARDIKVITELVINHTSDQHAWFQRARRAPVGSPEREFYVWNDSAAKYQDARIIFQDFETSNWTWDAVAGAYYWHRFYSHQPDLNFDNPAVQEEIFRVMEFWLDMGVDGMRLDAIPYLFEREGTNCENLPETHEFLRRLRSRIDAKYENRMLLAEANQWPEDSVEYFGDGDECHMSFHFPLMPRIFMSMQMEDRFPIIDILEQTPDIPESSQWALFLRNHDELTLEMVTDEERDYMYRVYARDPRARINLGIRRRLAPLLGNDRRKIELANVLLFSMPGTPVLYYGDEIGMGDNYYLGDRDGVRTPMQWSPDRNAGFSVSNPQGLYLPVIIDPEYHYESVNVENQQHNPSSLFWWTKRLIDTRRRMSAFTNGDLCFLHPENPKVLAFTRANADQTLLIVMNLSRNSQAVSLDLQQFEGRVPVEVFSRNRFPAIGDSLYTVTLGPWDYFWFELQQSDAPAPGLDSLLEYGCGQHWSEAVLASQSERLLQRSLLPYIRQSAWYQDGGRTIDSARFIDRIAVPGQDPSVIMCLVELEFTEGAPAIYSVILGAKLQNDPADDIPVGALAVCRRGEEVCYVVDAAYHAGLQARMVAALQGAAAFQGAHGRVIGNMQLNARDIQENEIHLAGNNLRNTAVAIDNEYLFKYYRRIEAAVNPEHEILQFLRNAEGIVPNYLGAVEYRGSARQPYVLALAQEYLTHETDGWSFATDSAVRSFEKLLTDDPGLEAVRQFRGELGDRRALEWGDIPVGAQDYIEPYILSFTEVLGRRTADLHARIAGSERKEFAPEPFSKLYQRSLYQSYQSQVRRVGQLIDKLPSGTVSETAEAELKTIRGLQSRVFQELRRVAGDKLPAYKIRVHNDFHLGQVLWTGRDVAIIDFEGRTDVSFSERRLKRPAMGDAADMMRSFHYAAFHAVHRLDVHTEAETALGLAWADLWYRCTSGLFLQAYTERMVAAGWLSAERDQREAILIPLLLQRMYIALEFHLQHRDFDNMEVAIHGIHDLLDSVAGK